MINKLKRQKAKGKTTIQNSKFLLLTSGFTFLLLPFYLACYAQAVSSTELINNAKEYDGKVVVYSGEVIGDVMARGENVWLNVNDGNNAIGIWLSKDLVRDISYTGSYKSKGDWLEITGIFNRACPMHGGDLDIHGQGVKKISAGRVTPEQKDLDKKYLAFSLLGVLILVWILRRLSHK